MYLFLGFSLYESELRKKVKNRYMLHTCYIGHLRSARDDNSLREAFGDSSHARTLRNPKDSRIARVANHSREIAMIITFKVDCRVVGEVDPFKVAIRVMEHIPPMIYSGEAEDWEAWVQNVEAVSIENDAEAASETSSMNAP
jgi:hypothetical protein